MTHYSKRVVYLETGSFYINVSDIAAPFFSLLDCLSWVWACFVWRGFLTLQAAEQCR